MKTADKHGLSIWGGGRMRSLRETLHCVLKKLLTGLRRDSSFFDGTFGAERGFDGTWAKTEGPTELAQLVIVSHRTLTRLGGIVCVLRVGGIICRLRVGGILCGLRVGGILSGL